MVKNILGYLKKQKTKKRIAVFVIFIIIITLILFIPFSYAALAPIKSITITSKHTSYEKKDGGAWQVKKSAIWKEKGVAEISFDVDTVRKTNNEYTDIIFVLDISGSMEGDKLNRVKSDTTELINSLLSDDKNRAAIITFETESELLSGLTNEKETLINTIESLTTGNMTNYYQALVNVDSILKNYKKEDGRECIVLFLTDGFPNEDIPNQNNYYDYLKESYPYITFNGIQYEMGTDMLEPIVRISDNQFLADMDTLNNVLFDASIASVSYKDFSVTDYIDTNHFYVDSSDDIVANQGKVDFDKNNQKFTWTINGLRSGSNASIKITARLKDEFINKEGVYPTNKQEIVKTTIDSVKEEVVSNDTPILATNYKVIYEGNAPDNCVVSNVPDEENHSVLDSVLISNMEPKCEGYQFKGWEIVTESVKKYGNNFIMPEDNVIIRATWTKVSVKKLMDGTVREKLTLYRQIQKDYEEDNHAKKYVGPTDTFNGKEDVYYYYGDTPNNNVVFAGFCWRMVRTTDTGGVKMIYNGVPNTNGECDATSTTISNSTFSNSTNSPADLGYMYNIRYVPYRRTLSSTNTASNYVYGNTFTYDESTGLYTLDGETQKFYNWGSNYNKLQNTHYTCWNTTGKCSSISYIYFTQSDTAYYLKFENGVGLEKALDEMLYDDNVNTYDSAIKKVIDEWYLENMTEYTEYLEDTVWCNDRTLSSQASSTGWNPNGGSTDANLYFRTVHLKDSLTCPSKNDRFTVSSENGNGKLTYPVGLITEPERALSWEAKSKSPLVTGSWYWTLSPYYFNSPATAGEYDVYTDGTGFYYHNRWSGGVRPVISIRPDMYSFAGNGTFSKPYIISLD